MISSLKQLTLAKPMVVYEVRPPLSIERAAVISSYIKKICEYYGIEEKEIMSQCRGSDIVKVRSVIYYVLRYRIRLSYPIIGKIFNKHHATIMHGVGLTKDKYMSDARQFMK